MRLLAAWLLTTRGVSERVTWGFVGETGREQTGFDVLRWIEKQVAIAGLEPPKLAVHSAKSACAGADAAADPFDPPSGGRKLGWASVPE